MADLAGLSFLFCVYLYKISSLYAGGFFILMASIFTIGFSKKESSLIVSMPSLLLAILVVINLINYATLPSFTKDLSYYLRCIQGYIYLILISNISFILKRFPLVKRPSRKITSLLLFYFPLLYLGFYLRNSIGSDRASWLFEHNFELVYLNILLLIAITYNNSPLSLFSSSILRKYFWIQGLLFSVLSLSLSGFLGYCTILFSSIFKNFKFLVVNFVELIYTVFRQKYAYVLILITALSFYIVYSYVNSARGGVVGLDRSSYWEAYTRLDGIKIIFGNGIGSIMPESSSKSLLLQSNLRGLLDSNNEATSLLLHSAILRIFFDTGIIGFLIIFWNMISIFRNIPSYTSVPFISIFMTSGLSVGSFFNPLGAFSMMLAVIYVVGFAHLLFGEEY